MRRRDFCRMVGAGLAMSTLGSQTSAKAELARDYFKGKSIRVLIPAGAGSGTDRSSRHFIAGLQKVMTSSRFRIENNERAGGQIMASELWRSPADGLTIGFPRNNLFYSAILQPDALNLQFDRFAFLGSLTKAHRVLLLSHLSEVRDVEELLSGERIVLKSASSAVSSHYYEALLMNALTGCHIRPIPGYEGGARNMAVITGEVDCQIGTIEAIAPILAEESGRIVFRLSSDPLPVGHTNVPRLRDHLSNPDLAWAVDIIDAGASLGRPVAAPPDTDPEALAHWRALFRTVVEDPEYRNSALAQEALVIEPSSADEINALLASIAERGDRLQSEIQNLLECGQARADNLSARCA